MRFLEDIRVTKLGMRVIEDMSDTRKKLYAYVFSPTRIVFHCGLSAVGSGGDSTVIDVYLSCEYRRNAPKIRVMSTSIRITMIFFISLLQYCL